MVSRKLIYTKPERVSLKNHPSYNEQWVQSMIAEDPSILGLGDLILRDRERKQPRAGRLDLLLQDQQTRRRYEVEIQLGTTNESHIIRTLEYWDIEQKRYPQYDHCAVIIAEDVTSRFLNVISLFNGAIPLIAIQMRALQVDKHITLAFTTIMDEFTLGLVDEDEDAEAEPTDRSFWERKATPATISMTDELLKLVRKIDSEFQLKYNKFYIGLEIGGQPNNFVYFMPTKRRLNFNVKLPETDDTNKLIDNAEFDTLEYDTRESQYRLRLTKEDISQKSDVLDQLLRLAYDRRAGL